MQKKLKTKAAGAASEQGADIQSDGFRPIQDGPVASAAEPDATPPDIIIE
jgi:hypothetical protein